MNSFGRIFSFTTWGESHGEAVGCIIDGCPANLNLTDEDIRKELQRDIPDQLLGTARKESNEFKIFSGIFEGKTIGTPICIVIFNDNKKSKDYEAIRYCYRPGHAEYTYHKRYGIYNPYGGGRASGRECIARLAVGAVAKKILDLNGIVLESSIEELAGIKCTTEAEKKLAFQKCVELSKKNDSTGGVIQLKISGVPAGIGNPVFGKLHSLIIYALSTIGGVKAVECGLGIESSRKKGSEFNDEFAIKDEEIVLETNNAGGVLGGISTGKEMIFRIYIKPTPSIGVTQKFGNWSKGEIEEISLKGRFDSNFTPRVGPVAESMAAAVLVDELMLSGYINPVKV